ncbi:MAG TPA: hypothetical protein DCS73_04475 [Roseburia sp.]|nr:hypothetical protein [Roseburia sp.]
MLSKSRDLKRALPEHSKKRRHCGRMKIEDNPSDPQMILTVRRMGYKWNVTQ